MIYYLHSLVIKLKEREIREKDIELNKLYYIANKVTSENIIAYEHSVQLQCPDLDCI